MTLSLIPLDDLETLERLAASAPPGDFVELGVYKGGSAERLYRIAEQQKRTLHLFDTFAGHQQHGEFDHANHPNGRFRDGLTVEQARAAFPNARIYVGAFPDAVWERREYWWQSLANRPLAFVHCDMDLYAPTSSAGVAMGHRLTSGGVILFDDYYQPDCPGVKKAVDEVFGDTAQTIDGRRVWIKP